MIARFLQIPVWHLNKIPRHYLLEAEIILKARHGARMRAINKASLLPTFNVDPFDS